MNHYFSEKPDSELRLTKITKIIRNIEMPFYLASGVFSAKKVDAGAQLLAEKAIVEDGWDVLDLGCGNGIIGVVLAKTFEINLVMSDINERAVHNAKRNAKMNKVKAKAVRSDGFAKIEGKFDTILLNPPQTAGKDVCLKLISDAKNALKPKGILQVVARHNKGGKSLNKFMAEIYKDVHVTAKQGGYRIYVANG